MKHLQTHPFSYPDPITTNSFADPYGILKLVSTVNRASSNFFLKVDLFDNELFPLFNLNTEPYNRIYENMWELVFSNHFIINKFL